MLDIVRRFLSVPSPTPTFKYSTVDGPTKYLCLMTGGSDSQCSKTTRKSKSCVNQIKSRIRSPKDGDNDI